MFTHTHSHTIVKSSMKCLRVERAVLGRNLYRRNIASTHISTIIFQKGSSHISTAGEPILVIAGKCTWYTNSTHTQTDIHASCMLRVVYPMAPATLSIYGMQEFTSNCCGITSSFTITSCNQVTFQ